jgi:hypothetical protein
MLARASFAGSIRIATFRPTAMATVALCNIRFKQTPAVSFAQIAVVPRRHGEWVKSTRSGRLPRSGHGPDRCPPHTRRRRVQARRSTQPQAPNQAGIARGELCAPDHRRWRGFALDCRCVRVIRFLDVYNIQLTSACLRNTISCNRSLTFALLGQVT